jgi:hypothetical protein
MGPLRTASIAIALAVIGGCASLPGGDGSPFQLGSAREPGQQALSGAIALYDAGDYHGAIRKLETSKEISTASVPVRAAAYKQLAFAQCALNRRVPCRRAFENLLILDPRFELSPLESGHPVWGPVFRQAKRDASTRALGALR